MTAYIKFAFVYFAITGMMTWSNFREIGKSVLIVVVVAVLVILPVTYAIILYRNRAVLSLVPIRQKIGSLYLGIRHERTI